MKVLLIALLLISSLYASSYKDDLVKNFPGWGSKTGDYDVYSGMLDVSGNNNRQIHYVLVESQQNPKNSPLVIWLNGGPGCSSLLGLIQENGPFQFQGDNTFLSDLQETSWNKIANVLYLEGPPGVGFSVNYDKTYQYTDENTGADFLEALVQFRSRFQSVLDFNNQPLWLSGESYAGMYVPFFTKAILDYNKKSGNTPFNVKGFLVGNNVQIMSDELLNLYLINQYVNNNFVNYEYRNIFNTCLENPSDDSCLDFLDVAVNVGNNTDAYQIYNYTYTYGYKEGEQKIQSAQARQLLKKIYENPESGKFVKLVYDKLMKQKIDDIKESKQEPDYYTPDGIINAYFNLEEVQKALHVPDTKWQQCSDTVGLAYQSAPDSQHLYPDFVDAGLDILIYSGNTDAVVPWQYTDAMIEDLQENYITMKESRKWQQWQPLSDEQVGGMVKYFKTDSGSTLAYAMVRAAGHEVPMYQPLAAYHMFESFINGDYI